MARLTVSGRHTGGPFAGVPATGRFASWGSIRIYRIEGGKVVETWAMQDRLGLLQRLGATPAAEGATGLPGESLETSSRRRFSGVFYAVPARLMGRVATDAPAPTRTSPNASPAPMPASPQSNPSELLTRAGDAPSGPYDLAVSAAIESE